MNNFLPLRPSGRRRPDPVVLGELRRRIGRLERAAAPTPAGAIAFGDPAIDGVLPWGGLPAGALNEVLGAAVGGAWSGPGFAAAAGFAAALAGRAGHGRGMVLWCRRGRGLYGPGLAALGLDPGRLTVIHGDRDADILWAMEEGLRSGVAAAVLGEVAGPAAVALRRLQLAAEAGGAAALLLHADSGDGTPSPATTRWRVAAAPSPSSGRWPGPPRWRVELLKCRGGAAASLSRAWPRTWPWAWLVEWRVHDRTAESGKDDQHGEAGGFAVAAELRYRPAESAAGGGRPAIRQDDGRLAV